LVGFLRPFVEDIATIPLEIALDLEMTTLYGTVCRSFAPATGPGKKSVKATTKC
jgi:hypothetical protein